MEPESDHRLLSVASAIAEGADVAWDEEKRHATDEDSWETLRGLRDIAMIFAAQRVIGQDYDTTAPAGAGAPAKGAEPTRWRHLTILNKIGEGSFGAVYRAYDSQLAVDVALKLLSPTRTAHIKNPDRVLNEARMLARVRHHNVVTVYGADRTDDYVGLWMEFIKGRTLGELLKTQGTFGAHESALIGRDLCRAVAAVHQAGIVHGDIKAHNVMRQEGGRTVLMDFGAGRSASDNHAAGEPRTLAGTPAYLAPEVIDGHAPSTSSDIYSLGVLLYHLVTGSYPISGHSLTEIVEKHKRGERRRLRDARPDLPDDFVRIVEQATAVDPARRFATAGALEDALARMTSPELPNLHKHQDKAPLVPVPRWVMLLAFVAVIAAVGATLWLLRGTNQARPAASVATATPSPAIAPAANEYVIDAAFYRAGRNGEERLAPGARVAGGDQLFLKFQASVPVHLYVVNEDDRGASLLLFPLPGHRQTNPIQANQPFRLPDSQYWVVTTAGGREHFLVFASPDRLESFEEVFAALPAPKENAPVLSASLEPEMVERLRSVGGLTPETPKQGVGSGLSRFFTIPLTNAGETVRGLWVRQLTVDNPGR